MEILESSGSVDILIWFSEEFCSHLQNSEQRSEKNTSNWNKKGSYFVFFNFSNRNLMRAENCNLVKKLLLFKTSKKVLTPLWSRYVGLRWAEWPRKNILCIWGCKSELVVLHTLISNKLACSFIYFWTIFSLLAVFQVTNAKTSPNSLFFM